MEKTLGSDLTTEALLVTWDGSLDSPLLLTSAFSTHQPSMTSIEMIAGTYHTLGLKANYLSMSTSPPLPFWKQTMSMSGFHKERLCLLIRQEWSTT